jgi:hypothetical protein
VNEKQERAREMEKQQDRAGLIDAMVTKLEALDGGLSADEGLEATLSRLGA